MADFTRVYSVQAKDFRALYAKVITDKHEDVMSKFGAILAQGIIDAGKCARMRRLFYSF